MGFSHRNPRFITKRSSIRITCISYGYYQNETIGTQLFLVAKFEDCEDIERITGSCKICLESRQNTAKTPLTPWQWPSKPWSRIHMNVLGPYHG